MSDGSDQRDLDISQRRTDAIKEILAVVPNSLLFDQNALWFRMSLSIRATQPSIFASKISKSMGLVK